MNLGFLLVSRFSSSKSIFFDQPKMLRCFGYAFPNLWRSLVQPRFPLLQNRPHRTHPSHPSIHPWCFHESSRDLAGQDHPSLFWNYGSANASHSECSAKPSPERMVSGFLYVNHCQTAVRLFDPLLVPLFDRWFLRPFLPLRSFVCWMSDWLIGTFFFGQGEIYSGFSRFLLWSYGWDKLREGPILGTKRNIDNIASSCFLTTVEISSLSPICVTSSEKYRWWDKIWISS